jgi:hypothetical protein
MGSTDLSGTITNHATVPIANVDFEVNGDDGAMYGGGGVDGPWQQSVTTSWTIDAGQSVPWTGITVLALGPNLSASVSDISYEAPGAVVPVNCGQGSG